jgi:hypothetical protein
MYGCITGIVQVLNKVISPKSLPRDEFAAFHRHLVKSRLQAIKLEKILSIQLESWMARP